MKFIYYILLLSVLFSCKAQYITQSNLKSGYEILDINKYDRWKKNKEIDFNKRYSLPKKAKAFYTEIENRNDEFRDFAFATHPDAYLDAGLTGIPISDKIKVSLTPDFKEWGSEKTWEQAILVMEEQISDWYKQAEAGLKEAQKDIEEAIEEAEKYLELFKDSMDIWEQINGQLDKYRNMPWLK